MIAGGQRVRARCDGSSGDPELDGAFARHHQLSETLGVVRIELGPRAIHACCEGTLRQDQSETILALEWEEERFADAKLVCELGFDAVAGWTAAEGVNRDDVGVRGQEARGTIRGDVTRAP